MKSHDNTPFSKNFPTLQKAIYIVGAKRTPFGAFGGKLKHITATDLAVHASKAALVQAGLAADKVGRSKLNLLCVLGL